MYIVPFWMLGAIHDALVTRPYTRLSTLQAYPLSYLCKID